MSSVIGLISRVYTAFYPPTAQSTGPDTRPIKFGVLGAAAIAPLALITPAKTHPETVVYAIAARDKGRAEAFARKHGIERAYGGVGGYQALLDDPEVEAVYNPLPNGLHYEWTMKALEAGKHVLLEKPSANTAEETRMMYDLAERKGLVLLEAFHYRFHPAIQRVKAILDSGELGTVQHIAVNLATPKGFIKPSDIRFDYGLGGGAMMDMGCYTMNCIRYLSSSNPESVLGAAHDVYMPPKAGPAFLPRVDQGTRASLGLPGDVTASLMCNMRMPFRYGVIPTMPRVSAKVQCDGGEVELFNFVAPTFYHSITVRPYRGGTRVEKAYTFREGGMEGKGEAWWTTYRYQLEAFVDRVKGREAQTWLGRSDAVGNMEWIEKVYEKGGLGSRPRSNWVDGDT